MKVKHLKILVLIAFLCVMPLAHAQDSAEVISDHIQNTAQGGVKVVQPDELRNRLAPKQTNNLKEEDEVSSLVGYRVQVFSDNNQRTAKSQAQGRKNKIASKYPNVKVYLIYKSPMWRVRVGDFKTRSEAEQMMYEIKEDFPAYASEVTVVLDEININEK